MAESNNPPPGIASLVRRLVGTFAGAVGNRLELLGVEWEEERARVAQMLIWACALVFCGLMATLLATAAILIVVPEKFRLVAVLALGVLYLGGGVIAWLGLKASLERPPFPETLDQLQKDRAWLDSLR